MYGVVGYDLVHSQLQTLFKFEFRVPSDSDGKGQRKTSNKKSCKRV